MAVNSRKKVVSNSANMMKRKQDESSINKERRNALSRQSKRNSIPGAFPRKKPTPNPKSGAKRHRRVPTGKGRMS